MDFINKKIQDHILKKNDNLINNISSSQVLFGYKINENNLV